MLATLNCGAAAMSSVAMPASNEEAVVQLAALSGPA